MENPLGLLRIVVIRGVNLAVRDACRHSSDPYIIVKMGKYKLKTRVARQTLNPEWNENLTLCVTNPNLPVKLEVYDRDTFSLDDKMGDAEFDIKSFMEAVKLNSEGKIPKDIRVLPNRKNCLAEESCIVVKHGKVTQDICLRLRNVECGEVELQLQWIDVPSNGLAVGRTN